MSCAPACSAVSGAEGGGEAGARLVEVLVLDAAGQYEIAADPLEPEVGRLEDGRQHLQHDRSVDQRRPVFGAAEVHRRGGEGVAVGAAVAEAVGVELGHLGDRVHAPRPDRLQPLRVQRVPHQHVCTRRGVSGGQESGDHQ